MSSAWIRAPTCSGCTRSCSPPTCRRRRPCRPWRGRAGPRNARRTGNAPAESPGGAVGRAAAQRCGVGAAGGADTGGPECRATRRMIAIGTFVGPAVAGADPGTDVPEEVRRSYRSASFRVPAQLPADIGDFTGRETHVAQLRTLLLGGKAANSPGVVRIVVVNGARGSARPRSPCTPPHQVALSSPTASSTWTCRAPAHSRPPRARCSPGSFVTSASRATRSPRGTTSGRRCTGRRSPAAGCSILLDNAKDAAQVRPLLPGSSSCAVLVTTRNRTSDLASMRFVDLNVLEDTEALALFSTDRGRGTGRGRAGRHRRGPGRLRRAAAGDPDLRGAARGAQAVAGRHAGGSAPRPAPSAGRADDRRPRRPRQLPGQLRQPQDRGRGADPARVFRLLGLWQGVSISLRPRRRCSARQLTMSRRRSRPGRRQPA